MGHRNWVVIADMAYPQQSNPAIETIYIGGNQVDAVKRLLKLIDAAPLSARYDLLLATCRMMASWILP